MKFQFLLLLLLLSFSTFSQNQYHDNDNHQLEKYELGSALTMVYSPHEKEFGSGFHLYGVRMMNPKVGFGYYRAFFHD